QRPKEPTTSSSRLTEPAKARPTAARCHPTPRARAAAPASSPHRLPPRRSPRVERLLRGGFSVNLSAAKIARGSHGLEIPVDHAYRAGAFADRGGDALAGSAADIAGGEDSGDARFEEKGIPIEVPAARPLVGASQVGARQHVTLLIQLD